MGEQNSVIELDSMRKKKRKKSINRDNYSIRNNSAEQLYFDYISTTKLLKGLEEEQEICGNLEHAFKNLLYSVCDYERLYSENYKTGVAILKSEIMHTMYDKDMIKLEKKGINGLSKKHIYRVVSELEKKLYELDKNNECKDNNKDCTVENNKTYETEKNQIYNQIFIHTFFMQPYLENPNPKNNSKKNKKINSDKNSKNQSKKQKDENPGHQKNKSLRECIKDSAKQLIPEIDVAIVDYTNRMIKSKGIPDQQKNIYLYESKIEELVQTKKNIKKNISIGERSVNRLVEGNLRLVLNVAKKYANKGMEFGDLIQEGNIGLIKAAYRFDYRKEYKFSTYATWWIRQAITRSMSDQTKIVHVPATAADVVSKYIRTKFSMAAKLGYIPKLEEVAEKIGETPETINRFKLALRDPIYLNQPVGGEDGATDLIELFEDINSAKPTEEFGKKEINKAIRKHLEEVGDLRDICVILMRFGLLPGRNYGVEATLQEIGDMFGVTREMIRQVEAKVLRKLKNPIRKEVLKKLYNED